MELILQQSTSQFVSQRRIRQNSAYLLASAMSGTEKEVAELIPMAERIIQAERDTKSLLNLSANELSQKFNVDGNMLRRLLAMFSLGVQVGTKVIEGSEVRTIEGAEDVFTHLSWMQYEEQEHFVVIYLNSASDIIKTTTIHIGTSDSSMVGIKEVFREAVREGAVAIIVAHNHPSGDPEPSTEDIEITGRLIEAGQLLDIEVCDHVIIGMNRWTSLSRLDLM
jgi:DNA repair protein RadC